MQLGTEVVLDFTLKIASTEDRITVFASPLDTLQTAVASVVTQQQIENLPINGRNFISFSVITPGVTHRSHAAAGRVGDVGADVRRSARALEQHHGRRPRQQRPRGRQRARDVQPGSGARVPGAHQFVLGGVRQGLRRRRQHRDQERHERAERQRVLLLPRRGAEREGVLREVHASRHCHRPSPKRRTTSSSSARRSADRCERNRTFFFASFERLDVDDQQLRHHRRYDPDPRTRPGGPARSLISSRRTGFPVETGNVPYLITVRRSSWSKSIINLVQRSIWRFALQLRRRPQREHRAVRRTRGEEPRRRARQHRPHVLGVAHGRVRIELGQRVTVSVRAARSARSTRSTRTAAVHARTRIRAGRRWRFSASPASAVSVSRRSRD